MQLRLTAAGPAHPDEVWDRYFRPRRWSEWSPQIRRVERSTEEIRVGTTGRVWGPPGLAVDFTVTDVDPAARTWAWRVRVLLLGTHLALRHGVEARDTDDPGAGTRTWLEVRGARVVVTGYAPLARLALSRLVRR
ncbi:hypothetical protein GCM10027047_35080 [Rhodococcus aerolatus]